MNPILTIFIAITTLFFATFAVKRVWKSACAICASISLTWMTLLALYWLGLFPHPILIAVLMGQSVTGLFKLLEKKVREPLTLFRLPFMITGTLAAYTFLLASPDAIQGAVYTLVLWIVFMIAYLNRNNTQFRAAVKRIIACCRDW